MANFPLTDRRHDDALDTAVIRVDQLEALAGLLSQEEVATQFAKPTELQQVSIFSLFETGLSDIRAFLGITLSPGAAVEGRTQ